MNARGPCGGNLNMGVGRTQTRPLGSETGQYHRAKATREGLAEVILLI